MNRAKLGVTVLLALALSGTGLAQKTDSTVDDAKDVVTQPGRDVGIDKPDVPPVLLAAQENPYGNDGAQTCAKITASLGALNAELGPDYDSDAERKKDSVLKKGGSIVVNSLVPFRSVVREVSGAAAADRRMQAATQAGIARRGFLRGLYSARRCRTGN